MNQPKSTSERTYPELVDAFNEAVMSIPESELDESALGEKILSFMERHRGDMQHAMVVGIRDADEAALLLNDNHRKMAAMVTELEAEVAKRTREA